MSFVYMENLVKFPLHHNTESCRSSARVTRFKRGQGSCSFKFCDEEGISPGSPYIQMRPAKIPFSIQLLKIQESCLPFQMVSLPLPGFCFVSYVLLKIKTGRPIGCKIKCSPNPAPSLFGFTRVLCFGLQTPPLPCA